MKTKPSGDKKRAPPDHASSKAQSNRRLKKIEMSKEGSPTPHAKKNDGASQSGQRKTESERNANERNGKHKVNGAKTNGGAAKNVRAPDMVRAINEKPSDVGQELQRTLGSVERNGEAAAEQSTTSVNDRTDPFDWGRIWLDWSYSMMPAALLTTKDLMRRRSPMDLIAIGSRSLLSSWLDVWLQVLESQRDRRTKA